MLARLQLPDAAPLCCSPLLMPRCSPPAPLVLLINPTPLGEPMCHCRGSVLGSTSLTVWCGRWAASCVPSRRPETRASGLCSQWRAHTPSRQLRRTLRLAPTVVVPVGLSLTPPRRAWLSGRAQAVRRSNSAGATGTPSPAATRIQTRARGGRRVEEALCLATYLPYCPLLWCIACCRPPLAAASQPIHLTLVGPLAVRQQI